ncbi:MAG: tetratricopeptide repeat protein [Burkholderiales bacterium]
MTNCDKILTEALELVCRGRWRDAICLLETVIANSGETSETYFLLGAARHRLGHFAQAETAFVRCLELDPGHKQAVLASATVLGKQRRFEEAGRLLRDYVERVPYDPEFRFAYAITLEHGGAYEAALKQYDHALELRPGYLEALMNRGHVLCVIGQTEEAVINNRRLVQVAPKSATSHFNLADSLLATKNFESAILACNQAIALDGNFTKAYINRALANIALGRVLEGERDLAHVRESNPTALEAFQAGFAKRAGGLFHSFDSRSLYLHLQYEWIAECDWARWGEFVSSLESLILESAETLQALDDPNLPFRALGFPISKKAYAALVVSVARGVSRRTRSCAPFVSRKGTQNRIRIGYISPDYRTHPGAYLTRRMYGLHDRERFEVFAYALYPDDKSEVRKDIERGCDVFRDVSRFNAKTIIDLIRRDAIDIAVDVSGYTNFTRPDIFAGRVAPVQVLYLGYPGSLGADWIDYAIVDHVVCPVDADTWWKERLVRLPHSYFITNNQERVDIEGFSRTALGLPDGAFVLCCFNNPFKIDPATFDVWMRILQRTERAILWILQTVDTVSRNLRSEAHRRNVDPERLVFGSFISPHERHLGRYYFADLFLDTKYYNAHTTAIDALWCGVPVITVPGDTMPSRVGASLLNAIGLPELICKDWTEYEEKAVWLATHPEELVALKRKLAANRDSYPLFDTEGQVRALEAAYEEMWRRHQAGLPPAAFDVKPLVNRNFRNAWH